MTERGVRCAPWVRRILTRSILKRSILTLVLTLAAAPAFAASAPCAACIALTIAPGQAILLPGRLHGVDVLVRVSAGDESAASAALEQIANRGGRPGVFVFDPRSPLLAALAGRAGIVLVQATPGPDGIEPLAFDLKTGLIAARAAASGSTQIGIAAIPAVAEALLSRDMASYVDFIVWLGDPPASASKERLQDVWRAGGATVPVLTDFGEALELTGTPGGHRWLWEAPPDVQRAVTLFGDLAASAPLLPPGLIVNGDVRVICRGVTAPTFLNPATLDAIAIARRCERDAPLSVTPESPQVQRVMLSSGDAIVRVRAATANDRFAEGVQVVGARTLTVEEIVARHQAAAVRQAARVHDLVSAGTLTLSFEAPGFPAPVTVTSEITIYTSPDRTELDQRDIRVNGMAFTGRGVPRLPIIEPERVAAPPLTITLSDTYRYRLAGEDVVGGTRCFVVAFDPRESAASLFRGRAWIAADSFAMVRVSAAQTGLRGAIVASEQVDEFSQQPGGIWLLRRSDVRQMYEGAAHRTPIHRVLAIARHEINPADFTARRQAAYQSSDVMLRDTPQGYRYLRRVPPSGAGSVPPEPVVAGRANRVRTFAAGVIVDPNITRPLPFAGLSYLDFDLFGTGAQLNAFFGGTYGQLAFSIPSIGGSRWQLAGRAFGIASSYNDRAFANGRERYEDNIRQRPAQASVWLVRPMTTRLSIRIGYDMDYTQFAAASETAASFDVPADQVVHGARLAFDAQRRGWNASVWWNPAIRAGWRAWGRPSSGDYALRHRDFQRYGASLVRSSVLSPAVAVRLEGAWMAGRDLDRFSRYSFGAFDNRLRGYPASLIRYDRGGVVRGALAWAVGRFARVDGFLDTASVHDPGFGRGLRNYTGLGAALETPAPFGTLLALEWGYGLRGVKSDGSLGTQVVRISGYKVF